MLDITLLYDSDCRASSLFEKSYKCVHKSVFSPLWAVHPPAGACHLRRTVWCFAVA